MARLRRISLSDNQLLIGSPFFRFQWKTRYSSSLATTHDARFPSSPSNRWLHLLSLCNHLRPLKTVHASLVVHGIDGAGDRFSSTKLMTLYGSFGSVDVARKVFDRIPDRDAYTWKAMTRCYFFNGLYREVIELHESAEVVDNVIFSMALKACSELKDVNSGKRVHCRIVKAGNPDSHVLTGLVDMYAKCGEIESSIEVFKEEDGDRRSVMSWTSMISGYVQHDRPAEALVLFNKMRQANEFTLVSLLTACTKLLALHQGKFLHGYIIKNGFEANSYLESSLVDMYVKCGSFNDARSVLNELSVVSWTAMIIGYTQGGLPEEALSLFVDKKWESVSPNEITLTSVLSACAKAGYSNFGKSVHCLGLKLGLLMDSNLVNALIDMYAKNGMNKDSFRVFQMLSNKNDVVAWNSILAGYSQNGSALEALLFFREMRLKNVKPDAFTLVSTFSAFGHLGSHREGSSLHSYSIRIGLSAASVYVGTAILSFYAKCGDGVSSRRVFDEMGSKNIVTWGAMIGGCGIQGDGAGSLTLFNEMLKGEEVTANEATFTAVLSACSRTGMVSEGLEIFNSMSKEYGFVPTVKHYACMVDLLARGGRLEEALKFLEAVMTVHRPEPGLLGSFLHGCGLHSRFDLAEVAIGRMLESGTMDASYYVLISNLYASDGRWGDVKFVRELMKRRGMKKLPGCSQVDMNVDDDDFLGNRVVSVG